MIRDTEIPDLISMTEAAKILGITRQGVHKRVKTGHLPAALAGDTIVLRRDLIVSIAYQEGQLLTWADLAATLGLPREAAEKVARFAGALTPHDPRTGRIPQPWAGQGMGYLLTRDQADELAAEWGRAAREAEGLSLLTYGRDPEIEEIADRYRP